MENFIAFWSELIRNPEKALAGKKGSVSEAVTMYLASLLLSILIYAIFLYSGVKIPGISGLFDYFGIPTTLAAFFIFSFVLLFINSAVYYYIARRLGGKGSFSENIYAYALVATLSPISTLLMLLLSFVPCLGPLFNLAFTFYFLYLTAIAIKTANSLTLARAAAVILVEMFILSIVFGILAAIAFFIFVLPNMGTFSGFDAITKATNTKNASICGEISASFQRDLCYSVVAPKLGDPSVCDKIETFSFKDSCYTQVAEKLKDPSICEKMSDLNEYGKMECKAKASAG